jgi:hypothetical protein
LRTLGIFDRHSLDEFELTLGGSGPIGMCAAGGLAPSMIAEPI